MKRLLTILAFASLLLSCHKNKTANSLVGSWKAKETYRIGQIDWTQVGPAEEVILTFNNDNTYTAKPPLISSVGASTGTYRIPSAGTLMMTSSLYHDPTYEDEIVYTVSGNTLILEY